MAKVKFIILIALFIIIYKNFILSSDFQRTEIKDESSNRITTGIGISHTYFDLTGIVTHFFTSDIILEYYFNNKYFFKVNFPLMYRISQLQNINKIFLINVSDPEVSIGTIFKIHSDRLKLSLNYSYPLGVWNKYQSGDYGFITGSGYHNLGLSSEFIKINDPLLISIKISYLIGLPRNEGFSWSMKPGDISIDLYFTELLNEEIAYSIGVNNLLKFPVINNGIIKIQDFSYNLIVYFSVIYNFNDFSINGSISKDLSRIISTFNSKIESYYDFKF